MPFIRPALTVAKPEPAQTRKPVKAIEAPSHGPIPVVKAIEAPSHGPIPVEGPPPISSDPTEWKKIHIKYGKVTGNTPADKTRRYYDFILKDSTADINFRSPTTAKIHNSNNSDFQLDFSKYNDSLIIGENNTDLNVNANMGKGDDHVFLNPNATGFYDLKGGEGQDLLKFSEPLNSVSSLSITQVNGLPRYKFVMNGGATVIFKEFETIKLNNQTFDTTTPAGQQAFKTYLESLV